MGTGRLHLVTYSEAAGAGLPEVRWKVLTLRWKVGGYGVEHQVTLQAGDYLRWACVCILWIPVWLISAGYGFLHFLVFLSCISKHKIHVMLKLFP